MPRRALSFVIRTRPSFEMSRIVLMPGTRPTSRVLPESVTAWTARLKPPSAAVYQISEPSGLHASPCAVA